MTSPADRGGRRRPGPTGSGTGSARARALAVSSRRRLLEVLRSAPAPLDAEQLAAAVDLHVTTARHHLDTLERAGLVEHAAERVGRPGRPRMLYSATPDIAADGYRALAHVLAAELEDDGDAGRRRAERAGRRWAGQFVPAGDGGSPEAAVAAVTALFDRLGFAPRREDDGPRRRLLLDACPFRDIARAHREVVCTMHLGLLRGTLDGSGATTAEAELRPFVEPELCVAELRFPLPASPTASPAP